jgi:hypothetical protein
MCGLMIFILQRSFLDVFKLVINVRFQVITAASMNFRVFCYVAPCSHEVDRRFRGAYCLHHCTCTSETSVNFNLTTRRYIPQVSKLVSHERIAHTIHCQRFLFEFYFSTERDIDDLVNCIAATWFRQSWRSSHLFLFLVIPSSGCFCCLYSLRWRLIVGTSLEKHLSKNVKNLLMNSTQ